MSARRKAFRADNVQNELDDLQRQYRMMENSRKLYLEDSQNTIRMQRQQIDKLKKDNDRLKEDLALETRQAKHANNMTASAQIAKLQDEGDMYARKIQAEQRRIRQLDEQIRKMEGTIQQQREAMGGVNASKDANQQVQKQIRILENRLDKALVKYNEALAHNKQLRETIDNLRRERVVFDGIYKKLERELHEKKNKMAEIITISNSAYEARDKAQAEMMALKAQADREQMEFEEKWASLGHLIEKDRKMKDFLKLKDASKDGTAGRNSRALVVAGEEGQRPDSAQSLDPALEEEKRLRKRVSRGAMAIAKDKAAIHLAMEKVHSYEEAFAKIQTATGISDIDQLVQTFINAEDDNFALFNQVNDLSNEIEKLEESIVELKDEISKYQGQGSQTDNQRKRILADLEQQLVRTEAKAKQYEEKHAKALDTVHALKQGIQQIFTKIGCNNSVVSEMLGNAGVTESNMMQYLGIIEQRTNELLLEFNEQQADVNEEGASPDDNRGRSSASPVIDLPSSTQQADDESDADEQPISMEEMQRMAARNMA